MRLAEKLAIDTAAPHGMHRAGIELFRPEGAPPHRPGGPLAARAGAKAAMLFLGSGSDWPRVHTPEYDFRDELIPVGIRIFSETLAACLENS